MEILQFDDIDRIVEIVKFVPQTVRVENVYAYAGSRARKAHYHLRVLLKILLEELMKLKLNSRFQKPFIIHHNCLLLILIFQIFNILMPGNFEELSRAFLAKSHHELSELSITIGNTLIILVFN